jgi:hypothetical protein
MGDALHKTTTVVPRAAAPPSRATRRPTLRLWCVVGAASVTLLLAACGDGTGEEAVGDEVLSPTLERSGEVGLEGVDVQLLDALAPYDHRTSLARVAMWRWLTSAGDVHIGACLRDEGFTDPPPAPAPPDPDDPTQGDNVNFPDGRRLAREGITIVGSFALVEEEPSGWVPPPGWAAAEARCRAELSGDELDAATPAQKLFTSIGRAWENELAAVEAEDEIAARTEEFSVCLQDHGIPAESTGSQLDFLGHLDGKIMGARDGDEIEAFGRQYGRMYGECGLPLFESRERLRAERRPAFFAEHAESLRELSDLVYGDG